MNIIPKKCSRCRHFTNFGIQRYLENNPKYAIQTYCIACFLYINLSSWKCEKCKNSGTQRIEKLGFLTRWKVIRGKKNIYHKCQCGNQVELHNQ
jgi:hypothetical protein